MGFFTLVLANIFGRWSRSLLTVVGVAVAICAVVALVGVARGFQDSLRELYRQRGIDLLVLQSGKAQQTSSALPMSLAVKIAAMPKVERIAPGLLDIIAINSEDLAAVPLQGWEVGSFLINDLRVVAGRRLEPRDQTPANGRQGGIMIGSAIARATQKSVGDTIEVLEGSSFEIVGVFNSFNIYENGSIVMPMIAQQKLMLREGEVTGIAVCTRQHDRETVQQVKQEIERLGPSLTANITREFAENLPEMKLAESVAWLTSSISLVVGSIGILNTMLMAVFERTGEIAMLRAIGWRRRRIVELILGESMVLAVTGAVIGCGLAVMLTHLLSSLPAAHRMVSGDISVKVFLWGFELAVAVGFLGGVYPAIRASRLLPVEGLRHN